MLRLGVFLYVVLGLFWIFPAQAWTDDPLNAGSRIRKIHIDELRTEINNKRTASGCGLAAVAFPEAITANTTPIRASHIQELRLAVSAIYLADGAPAPVFADDPVTADNSVVRAIHIRELRTASDNAPTCIPVCGNTFTEAGEECDDGNTANGDGCSSTCTIEPACGDGTLGAGEQCDDGNTANGDCCSSACQNEAACSPRCGDSIIQAGEECEFTPAVPYPATPTATPSCASNCLKTSRCGDGVPDFAAGEQCDNDVSVPPNPPVGGDGCGATCLRENAPRCGNGVIDQPSEECDNDISAVGFPPLFNPPSDCCDSTCKASFAGGCSGSFCGDGTRDMTEQCDDGNTNNGDGCDSECLNEAAQTGGCTICGVITGCSATDPDPGQACCPGTSRQYVQAPAEMCAPCSSYCTTPGYSCTSTPFGDVCTPPPSCSGITQECNGAPGSTGNWSLSCGSAGAGGCPGVDQGSCSCTLDVNGCNVCTYTSGTCVEDASCVAAAPSCPVGQCAHPMGMPPSWTCYACASTGT